MNKYKNAIDVVARYCSDVKNGVTPRMILTNELDILMELVEKATPKKVTHEAAKRTSCTCPNCLNVVDLFETKVRVKYDYCKICGQALDWSKDDVD